MEYILASVAIVISVGALIQTAKAKTAVNTLKTDLDYLEVQNKSLKQLVEDKTNLLGKQIVKSSQGKTISTYEIKEGTLYDQIPAQEAQQLIEQHEDCVIVDVREAHEYKAGHISNALHIPLGEIETRWEEISQTASHVIVYCAVGMRSASVSEFLSKEKNYNNIHNLKGGLNEWPLPLEKPASQYTRFVPEMTAAEAMAMHPRAREVFASFHLGGCSSCAIAEDETVGQIMHNYGVEPEMLLGTLNSLLDGEKVEVEIPPEADLSKEMSQ